MLTEVQQKAMEYISKSIENRGVSPTMREICEHMGYRAIGSVQDLVGALRKKGYLQETSQQSARSLLPTDKAKRSFFQPLQDSEFFDVPCLGRVPAGNPLAAIEDHHDRIHVSFSLFSKPFPKAEELFAVRAVGLSMMNAGIMDGDWLVVRSQQQVSIGSIVIARIDDDVTCKRFMADKKHGWYLQPENDQFKNIYAKDLPFEIVGKVLALQRSFE